MSDENESAALAEFERMVTLHELTFDYSDDSKSWQRGRAERAAIMEAAKSLPREKVVEIWNRNVDRVMRDGYRKQFYWKV